MRWAGAGTRTRRLLAVGLPVTPVLALIGSFAVQARQDRQRERRLATTPTLQATLLARADEGRVYVRDVQEPVPAGRVVSYALQVVNPGPGVARGVAVGVNMPPFMEYECGSATLRNGNTGRVGRAPVGTGRRRLHRRGTRHGRDQDRLPPAESVRDRVLPAQAR